jgi:hypothetical protein
MKSIWECTTLQICTTNACVLECSNCTHLVGHAKKPYMMDLETFKKIVDSLEGYPNMIGMIGGEVLLSPWFEEQARYLRSKFPREQLGLWSVFPEGEKYRRYRDVICESFGNILLNDHSVPNIMHAPILVASGEFFANQRDLRAAAWNCWVQNAWSPGITPKGAFFCEVAGELDYLFEGPGGWDVSEPGWWKRTPAEYLDQIDRYCSRCGACMPMARRSSQDNRDDISEGNFKILQGKSSKIAQGKVVVYKSGEFPVDADMLDPATGASRYPDQSPYKDEAYRKGIAARYGIILLMNSKGYWDPRLQEDIPNLPGSLIAAERPRSLFSLYQEEAVGLASNKA